MRILFGLGLFLTPGRNKFHGRRIHAVTQTGRGVLGIVKDMPQVTVAFGAMHLRANAEELAILGRSDRIRGDWLEKTRPARATFEFRIRRVKRLPASATGVDALLVVVTVGILEGSFGACLAQHLVLLRGEKFFPLLVRFDDLALCGCGLGVFGGTGQDARGEQTRSAEEGSTLHGGGGWGWGWRDVEW